MRDHIFVGREREIERCLDALARALEGSGGVILVSGEAGIGKTRFVERVQEIALSIGYLSITGRCLPGHSNAYFPFIEAIRALEDLPTKRHQKSDTYRGGRTRTDLETAPRSQDGERTRNDRVGDLWYHSDSPMFSLLELLETTSHKTPLLIVIEDLHWADSLSLQLIHFLARNVKNDRIAIMITYRSEDIIGLGSADVGPIQSTINAMKREGICQEIKLEPFDQEQSNLMMGGYLGGPLEDQLFGRLWAESRGNPLFLLERTRLLIETGAIGFISGRWRLIFEPSESIPPSVQGIIRGRIERLSDQDRRVLEVASVIGVWFDVDILLSVVSGDRLVQIEQLEEIDNLSHLIVESHGRYHFSHELIQRSIYGMISPIRRKELHLKVGNYLEEHCAEGEMSAELSNHFFFGGDQKKCIKYSEISGEIFLKRCGYVEAIPYLERVLALADGCNLPAGEISRTVEMLGDAEKELGHYAKASEIFESYLANSKSEGDDARVLRKLAECWTPGRLSKDIDVALELLDRAERCEGVAEVDRGELWSVRAALENLKGNFERSETFRSMAEEIFRKEGLMERTALEQSVHAYSCLSRGLVNDALTKLEQAGQIFLQHPNDTGQTMLYLWLGQTYAHMGRTDEALTAFHNAIKRATKVEDHYTLRWSYFYIALLLDNDGKTKEAFEWVDRCNEVSMQEESVKVMVVPLTLLAHLRMRTGDLDRAMEDCQKGIESLGAYNPELRTPFHGMAIAVMGEIQSKRRNWVESNGDFEKGIEMLVGVPISMLFEGLVRTWYVDSLVVQGDYAKANDQCRKALDIFQRLGNGQMIERTNTALREVENLYDVPIITPIWSNER